MRVNPESAAALETQAWLCYVDHANYDGEELVGILLDAGMRTDRRSTEREIAAAPVGYSITSGAGGWRRIA